MRKRCAYCAMESKENRTFVICLACNIPLCLVKERNLFPKASHLGVHIIYTLYIFAKTLCFAKKSFCLVFIYFHSLFEFFIYYFLHIYSYFQYFVFWTSKSCQRNPKSNFPLEVMKTIPTDQLLLCLIRHFN